LDRGFKRRRENGAAERPPGVEAWDLQSMGNHELVMGQKSHELVFFPTCSMGLNLQSKEFT